MHWGEIFPKLPDNLSQLEEEGGGKMENVLIFFFFSDESHKLLSQERVETVRSLSPACQKWVRDKETQSDGFVLCCGTGRLLHESEEPEPNWKPAWC